LSESNPLRSPPLLAKKDIYDHEDHGENPQQQQKEKQPHGAAFLAIETQLVAFGNEAMKEAKRLSKSVVDRPLARAYIEDVRYIYICVMMSTMMIKPQACTKWRRYIIL
jgi:hypothetical protein